MTKDELVEKCARAVGEPLANMNGGCFNPHDTPRGECADADCYCARVCRHVARAALAIAMPAAFEMAAEVAEKRAEARFADFGTTEPDTNASYYSGRRGETLDELDEEDWHIAQTIRAEGEKWK